MYILFIMPFILLFWKLFPDPFIRIIIIELFIAFYTFSYYMLMTDIEVL